MPIYEYTCTACAERVEARQAFTDPPLEVCAVCGGRLRKLYSPVGVVFKGSGFYSTDKKGAGEGKPSTTEESKTSTDRKEATDSSKAKGSSRSKDSTGSKDSRDSKTSSGSKGSDGRAPSAPRGTGSAEKGAAEKSA
ncbi:MAG: FmdB family zinc ribbon protein [Actinomycetota bacterium]